MELLVSGDILVTNSRDDFTEFWRLEKSLLYTTEDTSRIITGPTPSSCSQLYTKIEKTNILGALTSFSEAQILKLSILALLT